MRPNYEQLPEYLDKIWAVLVQYQKDVCNHFKEYPKCVLDSVGGTGKTLMALFATMARQPRCVLIVCSSNALWTWQKEVAKWFKPWSGPEHFTVIEGYSAAKRRSCWSKETLFYACTYGTLRADKDLIHKLQPSAIICDEYHKGGLKNRNSQTTKVLKELEPYTVTFFTTSGSGIRKGPPDLWALLNLLARKVYTSYWQFVYKHCHIDDTKFGKQILGTKNPERFLSEIKTNYVRVPRSISDAQKPKLLRKKIYLQMTSLQKKHYHELANEMCTVFETEGGDFDLIASSSIIGVRQKMRKLLICPEMLGIQDLGSTIDAIIDQIENREDPHTVIFTPFLDGIPILKRELQKKYPDVKIMTLQGGNTPEDIKAIESTFRTDRNTMVICSLQYAQSFELESAQYCHFAGFDWDQGANEQCEWRLQRMTADIKQPITAYYYMYRNTIDEDILETLNTNTLNVKNTFKSIDELKTHLGV